jgi:hypothetical protein
LRHVSTENVHLINRETPSTKLRRKKSTWNLKPETPTDLRHLPLPQILSRIGRIKAKVAIGEATEVHVRVEPKMELADAGTSSSATFARNRGTLPSSASTKKRTRSFWLTSNRGLGSGGGLKRILRRCHTK